MIHGTAKTELSYESAREALEEWMQRHMAPSVKITLARWSMAPAPSYGQSQGIVIEFTQEAAPDVPETEGEQS